MSMFRVVGYSYARRNPVNRVKRAIEGDCHVQPDIIIVQANARMRMPELVSCQLQAGHFL